MTTTIIALTAATAAIAGCSSSGPSTNEQGSSGTGTTQDAKADYVIGFAAEITGPGAAIAKGEITGIQAYIHSVNQQGGINGHQLKLVTADTTGVATKAVATLTKLATSDHVIAAFGDILANNCQAQVPVAQQYKVPILCGTIDPADLVPPKPYVYVEYGAERTQTDAMFNVVTEQLGISNPKVALVYVKSTSTVPFFKDVTKKVESSGGKVVLDQQLEGGTLDLSVTANKVVQSGADVILEQVIPQQLQSLAESLKQAGHDVPIVAEATTASYPGLVLLKNPNIYELSLNPFVDSNSSESAVQDYLKALKASAGLSGKSDVNGQSIAMTYAAAAFLGEALTNCGDNCDGEQLNAAMEKTKLNLPGINTDFSFTSDRHYPNSKFLLYKWSDEKNDVVELADDLPTNPIPTS